MTLTSDLLTSVREVVWLLEQARERRTMDEQHRLSIFGTVPAADDP